MDLLKEFQQIARQQDLFSPGKKLLLAVSGGVDSVVLCQLCYLTGFDFTIAHCNFQLRGEESLRDEEFVNALGEKYGVEVKSRRFDTDDYAAAKRISIQEAARELRYQWFASLAGSEWPMITGELNAGNTTSTFLLTAHHADDNAETILMNFCRGTGLHGLTGIPPVSGFIRRPLLSFSKETLVGFAREHSLTFVEDSSNLSTRYTRNFFRNEVLPLISGVYPGVRENLQDNVRRFRDIEKLYQYAVGEVKKKLCRQKGKELHIPVKQLLAFNNRALIYEIIREYDFSEKQVEEVIKLSASESGRFLDNAKGNYRIIRHRHWFIICPARSIETANTIIEMGQDQVVFGGGHLRLEKLSGKFDLPAESSVALIDLKEIEFPLLLRKWKAGDYFYPLGMKKKKKKLARFLIDLKLSKPDKENTWVIESNKRIIWVVGRRIDERFRVNENTKTALRITPSL